MTVRVFDRDKGWDGLVLAFKSLGGGQEAVAGIQGREAQKESDGVKNVDKAVWNEFGTITAPERSFIRATVDRERRKYADLVQRAVKKGLDGGNIKIAMGRLAQLMASDMRKTIDQTIGLEPLAFSTIRARSRKRNRGALGSLGAALQFAAGGGGEKPLDDTGQMKRAITGVVRRAR